MARVGDIFKLNTLSPTRYFQLVAFDETQLGGAVIAILKFKGNAFDKYLKEDLKKIFDSGVEFYTHTIISVGINEKWWERIGRLTPHNYDAALFKQAYYGSKLPDAEPYEANHYHSWVIWRVNKPWTRIGPDIDKYPDAELGAVYPAEHIVYRIAHGKYPGAPYYGHEK